MKEADKILCIAAIRHAKGVLSDIDRRINSDEDIDMKTSILMLKISNVLLTHKEETVTP